MNQRLQKGYTLIELMIALFIFSIISLIIAVILNVVISSRESIITANRELEEFQACLSRMDMDLLQMLPYTPQNSAGLPQPMVSWMPPVLTFTRAGYLNPGSIFPRTNFATIRYQLSGDQLLRFADSIPYTQLSSEPQILLNQVTSLKWEFYDQDSNRYQDWPPVQALSERLPSVVHLTMTLKNLGTIERYWITPEQVNEST